MTHRIRKNDCRYGHAGARCEYISPHPVHRWVTQPWTLEPVERRNVSGEGKHRVVREGRAWNQEEAVPTERRGTEAWPAGMDQVCRKPMWYAIKGGV